MLFGTGEVVAPPGIAELPIFGGLGGTLTIKGIELRGMAAVTLIVIDVDVK